MAQPPLSSSELSKQHPVNDDIDSSFPENPTNLPGSPRSAGESVTLGNPSQIKRHCTPIHLLPEEIFLEVIRLCMSTDRPLRDLVALTWVCRRWKIVLEGEAGVWSRISAAESLPCIQKAVQLAKGVPLDLVYTDKGHRTPRDTFFKGFGDRAAQWRSLVAEVDGWSMSSPLANLGTTSTPKLELLRLVNTVVTGNSNIPVTLFGGAPAPPSLKALHLSLIPVMVAPLHLSHLESLTLQGVQTVFTTDILRILADSPGLQTLHLASLHSLDEPNPRAPTSTRIRLSALCDLQLENLPPSFIQYLLSIIEIPNLHTLELICDDSGRMTSEILTPDTFHLIPVLAAMTMDAQDILVTLSGYYHYCIFVGHLTLGGWMEDPPTDHVWTTVDWICKHLNNRLRNLPVHLSITDSDPQLAYLDSFSSGLRVSKLTLWSDPYHGPHLEEFIPPLSDPTLSPSSRWILPHLEVVEANLIWGEGNYDFVDFVRNRHVASTVRGEAKLGSEVVVPKRLRELYLSASLEYPNRYPPPNSAFMQALHEAGNDVNIYWHGCKWSPG